LSLFLPGPESLSGASGGISLPGTTFKPGEGIEIFGLSDEKLNASKSQI
jgi:hypothetical protein